MCRRAREPHACLHGDALCRGHDLRRVAGRAAQDPGRDESRMDLPGVHLWLPRPRDGGSTRHVPPGRVPARARPEERRELRDHYLEPLSGAAPPWPRELLHARPGRHGRMGQVLRFTQRLFYRRESAGVLVEDPSHRKLMCQEAGGDGGDAWHHRGALDRVRFGTLSRGTDRLADGAPGQASDGRVRRRRVVHLALLGRHAARLLRRRLHGGGRQGHRHHRLRAAHP
mmetsp:Transcript_30682/g.67202  ORF Transcript_30682/g.67202 Transcript_30682/m.67202 type:complete len:227 (-) Transcript_30682:680-1360(-)